MKNFGRVRPKRERVLSESPQESRFVDLHLHTNHSDGSDSPARVVERAVDCGLSAMAITDHDTVSGVAEAAEAAARLGIELLSGVEISSKLGKREVHILGLGVDPGPGPLVDALERQAEGRRSRAERMVARLNDLGVPVDRKKIEAKTADGVVGRMHIAQEIMAVGCATNVQDAFDKYIKAGRPAYVPKDVIAIGDAVDLIQGAKGLALVAHPGLGNLYQQLDALLKFPFDGIEVYHSRHTPGQIKTFEEVVQSKGLLATGGSDCHGTIKGEPPLMGCARVPYRIYKDLRSALTN